MADIDGAILQLELRLRDDRGGSVLPAGDEAQEVGEDQRVFEALPGAGALVRGGGVGGVAEDADELVEVGGCVQMVMEGPADGFCVLISS